MTQDKTIVIGALARDCADSILRNKNRIEELRKHFVRSYVVIVENDSKDNTKQVLADYASECNDVIILSKDYNGNFPFHYEGPSLKPDMSRMRIARMSFIRNILVDYIEKNIQSDYTMFLDIDVLDFNVAGIIDAINNAPEDWGALLANGREQISFCGNVFPSCAQYDTYATLFDDEDMSNIPLSCTKPLTKLFRGIKSDKMVQSQKYTHVHSAFGGIGIYRSDAIKGLRYSIYEPKEWQGHNISICEHIPFHNNLKGQCYIAQDIQVTYHIDSIFNSHNDLKRKALILFLIIKHYL